MIAKGNNAMERSPEPTDQVGKIVFQHVSTIMKATLDLEEFSYREHGREDVRFKTFKRHLMRETYDQFRALMERLAALGIVSKTPYDEDVINGYRETPSGGSGFINTDEFVAWIKKHATD
jgi:hypothetical protein